MAYYLINSRNVLFRQIILQRAVQRYLNLSEIRLQSGDVERGSIVLKNNNPFDLFNDWFNEANGKMHKPLALCFVLSNYSPERNVQSRVMMYAGHKDDKFTIFGSNKTQKMQDITRYPDISMCFYWTYQKDNYMVLRQVRITGKAGKLSNDKMKQVFDKLNLPLRIEWTLSRQNEVVQDWKKLQEKFGKMNQELKTGEVPMPSYMTGLLVTVNEIQFFHNILKTKPFFYPDRVLFKREGNSWTYKHIGA